MMPNGMNSRFALYLALAAIASSVVGVIFHQISILDNRQDRMDKELAIMNERLDNLKQAIDLKREIRFIDYVYQIGFIIPF